MYIIILLVNYVLIFNVVVNFDCLCLKIRFVNKKHLKKKIYEPSNNKNLK